MEYNLPKKSNTLPNNPRNERTITFKPVHAYLSYDENKKAKLLVVNLTSEKLKLNIGDIITKGQLYQYVESLNENDAKSMVVNVEGSFEILPYSINLLEE